MRTSTLSFLTAAYLLMAAWAWIVTGRVGTALIWTAIAAGWLIVGTVRRSRQDRLSPEWRALLRRRMIRLLWLS